MVAKDDLLGFAAEMPFAYKQVYRQMRRADGPLHESLFHVW